MNNQRVICDKSSGMDFYLQGLTIRHLFTGTGLNSKLLLLTCGDELLEFYENLKQESISYLDLCDTKKSMSFNDSAVQVINLPRCDSSVSQNQQQQLDELFIYITEHPELSVFVCEGGFLPEKYYAALSALGASSCFFEYSHFEQPTIYDVETTIKITKETHGKNP